MKYSVLVFVLSILSSFHGFAKDWYRSEIEGGVSQAGYYNIELNQQLIGCSLNSNFGDVRILDSQGKEVPYFVRSDNPVKEISSFTPYKIESVSIRDSVNTQIIDNNSLEEISRIYVIVRNAETAKYVQVRGSNDLKQWYIVKRQSDATYSGFGQTDNSEILVIDVPKGNYKYYELRLTTDQRSPVEILKIGKFSNSNIYGQLSPVNLGNFIIKDSTDRRTYIEFPDLKYNYKVSKLVFGIKSKPDYYRNIRLEADGRISFSTNLSSKGTNTFFFDNVVFSSDSRLIIDNNDNAPLAIDSIQAYGLNRYLCAYLDKGQKYTIVVQHKNYQSSPQYDVAHFIKDIPEDLPIVTTSIPVKLQDDESSDKRDLMWFEKPLFLWFVISIAGLFLFFVCFGMIKDMKKKSR